MNTSQPISAPRHRYDGWTLFKQQEFLRALAEHGAVTRAAEAVDRSASSAYRLRGRPDAEAFREGWKAAIAHCMAGLRETAINRALNGYLVPVMRGEVEVGTKHVYNDRLLMFLLRHYDLPGYNATSPALRDVDFAAAALASSIAALTELPGETFLPGEYAPGEQPPQWHLANAAAGYVETGDDDADAGGMEISAERTVPGDTLV